MDLLFIKKSFKKNNLIWHVLAWVGYAIFLFTTNLLTRPTIKIFEVIVFIIPYCLTFYISVFCLGLYKKWGLIWSISSFFIVFTFMSSVAYIYVYWLLPNNGVVLFQSKEFKVFFHNAILGYVQHFAYAVLYFYFHEAINKERELRELQKEKIQKELENAILKQQELKAQKDKIQYEYAFLRAQINPHFLHNTLNVLFSQALDYSQELADNILKLSRIMRYSLESLEYESGKVSIQKELEHLQTLLEINNMRFGDSKTIEYIVEGQVTGQMLPPLSIMTIVENAFKYGDLKDPSNPMKIKIVLKPNEIYFYCRNKKKKNNILLSSTNIGIANLSKRLDVTFKDMYEMRASDELEFYTLELIVKN